MGDYAYQGPTLPEECDNSGAFRVRNRGDFGRLPVRPTTSSSVLAKPVTILPDTSILPSAPLGGRNTVVEWQTAPMGRSLTAKALINVLLSQQAPAFVWHTQKALWVILFKRPDHDIKALIQNPLTDAKRWHLGRGRSL